MLFQTKNPHYEYLRKRWGAKHKEVTGKLLSSHGDSLRRLTLGGLGGLVLLTTPGMNILPDRQVSAEGIESISKGEDKNADLARILKNQVPPDVRRLTPDEETKISKTLSEQFGIKITPEINGIRLNRSYGLIGGEQHLYRYPGDNLYKHANSTSDWAMFGPAGMAPNLGAWGYFAPSEKDFSEKDMERERYYIAVQTFLTPGFAENVDKYRDFFKFRKMLLVNPLTGQSVVADIGDAGPAEWTGKHLGGSPEVMDVLGLGSGPRKGPVLYFFIDDPKYIVPLGPIQVKGGNKAQVR